ncbi:hypothetical protein QBC43DRAFT_76078 [Cladorrhinum sp. PSN259]|nr:hypothetical protein QBC43DRAFT_76078 [Cladorrhinum sp. PSN259]
MFGSRRHHRPNPQPLTASTVDPNAATAAAAVFKRHESNANATLSAAAAAAALRARPMTPTRVADVQTKRTIRRSASVASSGTASPIQGRPSLQRRGSSGSMTERTFRSPSPHRPGSSGSGHRQTQPLSYDAPPVPAIPKDVNTANVRSGPAGVLQGAQHRKSNSLGMGTTPLRLASERLKSEDPPSWFSAARLGDPANIRRTDPAMASPPSSPPQMPVRQEEVTEGGRPSSRASSINFSYPARTRVGSPPVSPVDVKESVGSPARITLGLPSMEEKSPIQTPRAKQQLARQPSTASPRRATSTSSDQALVYDPNSRRMVRQVNLRGVQQGAVEPLQQTGGSKKKKKSPQRAGTHLAAGTVGRIKTDESSDSNAGKAQSRSAGLRDEESNLASASPVPQPREDAEEPAVKAIMSSPRIEARKLEQKQRAAETVKTPYTNDAHPTPTSSSWQGVRRQPSVVREEPEPEEEQSFQDKEKSPQVVPQNPHRASTKQTVHANADPGKYNTQPSQRENTSLPDPGLKLPDTSKPEGTISPVPESKRQVQVAHQRSHSNSPARQAHFGPVQENLTVKHSPPPRSISPRKSALKHSSPSRGASVSDDTSEASLTVSHEPPVGRKKSVRVSFGDDNGNDAGDHIPANPLPSPPTSTNSQDKSHHRWFSTLGREKTDISLLDDDEIMKPRPALPSFGSVRARKPRSVSPDEMERPLVRPLGDTAHNIPVSVSPGLLPSPPLGSSNDHAIGSVFSNEREQKGKDSTGIPGLREPLPPVVTSVEGTGYFSDSSSSSTSSSDPEEAETFHDISDTEKEPANGSANDYGALAGESHLNQLSREPQIPIISISQPTPPMVENKTLKQYFVDVPGGFPEDESDRSGTSGSKDATAAVTPIHPAQDSSKADQQSTLLHAQPTQPVNMEQSSDSETSIYSDAYEDLSDIDGDGFQSLNAVVESPLQTVPASGVILNQPPNQTSSQPSNMEASKLQTKISSATSPPTAVKSSSAQGPEDEWERVKTYWRNLSAEKRAQLEKEATEDAGIEADLEEEKQEPKPKKKKSLERRNSERKALALHMAQQMAAQSQSQNPPAPERSYQIKPGTRWTDEEVAVPSVVPTMRKSMRGPLPQPSTSKPASGAPRLRKSMRGTGPSPRTPEPRSSSSLAISPVAASEPHHAPAQPSLLPPTLRRRGSSSSESSFKRSRARVSEQVSGFRKSMRPTSPPLVQSETRSPMRLSLRGSSPTGLVSKQNAEAVSVGAQMRRTLRDSSTGRKSPTGIHLPGFGKKGSAKALSSKSSSRFSSRFGDSSDEGSYASASGFQSRFEDSSEDDSVVVVPASIPQSRSAPAATTLGRSQRNQESLASTALPEELEESDEPRDANMNGTAKQPAVPQQNTVISVSNTAPSQPILSVDTLLRRSRSGRGSIVPISQTAPSLGTTAISSPPTDAVLPSAATEEKRKSAASRRNSIMSVLRRKKHDSFGGRISRAAPTESAARRDTKLERSEGQLNNIRYDDDGNETPSPAAPTQNEALDTTVAAVEPPQQQQQPAPRSPKLKKKNFVAAVQRQEQHQSPPVMIMPGGEELMGDLELKRTPTSGNLGTRTLSGTFLQHQRGHGNQQQHRKTFSTGAPSVDGGSLAGSMGTTTKKKRFGALRRMFRLDE